MSFAEKSYSRHENSYTQSNISELEKYRTWFDVPTTDLFRHLKMLSVLNPFLKIYPQNKWLTVGDGRFGTSATYIERMGSQALASDIDDQLLKIAFDNKMISEFKKCNAEQLPFADDTFDFSYCKQAYHHFPRPAIAVYEMLRVSKKAIMFTEPGDWIPAPFTRMLLQKFKHILSRTAGKQIQHRDTGNYEPDGNYVFTISEREFEKIALGLNLPAVAFKRFHDFYEKGMEDEIQKESAPLYKKYKNKIAAQKRNKFLGLTKYNNIQAIIFKEKPSEQLITELRNNGYQVSILPENPYI